MLSLLIFLPLAGGFLLWWLARGRPALARWLTLALALAELAVGLALWSRAAPGFFATERAEWMPAIGLQYLLAMDGVSLVLALLTAVVTLSAVLVAWRRVEDWGLFGALLLAAEGGIMGVLTALDLVLFYVFWEVMIVPIYFLIALRGGPRAAPAAMRFFLFTIVGSLLMLVALVALYLAHGQHSGSYTFEYFQLLGTPLSAQASLWLMLGFLAAFAVKVPMLPLHVWAPDAYCEAEPPVAILLSGAMANVGAYGILRFCLPLFPDGAAAFAPLGMALGAVGVIYAGLLALVQDDLKRVIAYSSISHMSLVVLGLFAWQAQSLSGAVFLLLAHGLAVAGLFAVAAWITDRGRSTALDTMGGWYRPMPRLGVLFLLLVLAGVGLPGLANFVGEFLVLAGSAERSLTWAAVATAGIVVSVAYFLRMYERSMLGPRTDEATLADLGVRETLALGALIALILWLGLYPASFLGPIEATTAALADLRAGDVSALSPGAVADHVRQ
jgi:NADH-quinone oxidoreductase subunit M